MRGGVSQLKESGVAAKQCVEEYYAVAIGGML